MQNNKPHPTLPKGECSNAKQRNAWEFLAGVAKK